MATEFLFKTRNEWLEGRRTLGIGSSDAPAILGISRYKSAFQLYLEKRGLESASKQENEQIAWGNLLEEPIAQRFAEETGRDVRNPREPGIWRIERSVDVDFMVAAVDRTQRDPQTIARDGEGILEIKNAHFFVGKTWLDTQEPPPEFQVQLQHQLVVTGARWGSIAALIGGCRFVWADVPRDEEFIELLIQAEAEFWKRLTDGNPPDPDGTDATKKAIDRLFTRETSGQIIGLPPDIIDAHIELQDAKVALDKAATRKKAAENTIKMAIGENVGGRLPDGTVYTWKSQTRREYVSKESTFRVLRCSLPKTAALPPGKVSALETDIPETEATQ